MGVGNEYFKEVIKIINKAKTKDELIIGLANHWEKKYISFHKENFLWNCGIK